MEWNTSAGKKSKKAQARESQSALVKADHLRLWGAGTPVDPVLPEERSAPSASAQSARKSKRKKPKKKQASSVEMPAQVTPTTTANIESNNSTSYYIDSSTEVKVDAAPEQPEELESPKSAASQKYTSETSKNINDNGSTKVMDTLLPKGSVPTPPASSPQLVGADTPPHKTVCGSEAFVEQEPASEATNQCAIVNATDDMGTKDGTKHDIVHSTGGDTASVDHTISPDLKAQWDLVDSFEAVAGGCANEIRSAITQLPGVDSPGGENCYLALQVAILRANQTIYHLEKAKLRAGAEICSSGSSLATLRSALQLAGLYKEDMNKVLPQKKNRTFKNIFHNILKTGKASEWLAAVPNETLVTDMQADGNRLYQLLMEGKKLNHLELVDAGTLFAASGRRDIFSSKHVQALRERLTKVELQAEEDARACLIQSEKQAAAESLRQSLEARASFANLGDNVRICGLPGRPDLNGKLATYAGLGEGDLYIIRLYEGEFISLPQHNFFKWDGLAPAAYVSKQNLWKPTIWNEEDIRLIEYTDRKNAEINQSLQISSPAAKPASSKSKFKVRVVSPRKFSKRQPRAYRGSTESRRPPVTADESGEILQVYWLHKKKVGQNCIFFLQIFSSTNVRTCDYIFVRPILSQAGTEGG